MEKRKVIFIVNFLSGTGKKEKVLTQIKKHTFKNIQASFIEWREGSQWEEIKKEIHSGDFDTVVAVGGDGTVNSIASTLLHSNKNLGIVPQGSGNGLARNLGIAIDVVKALKILDHGKVKKIDAGSINERYFFCAAGIGFEAAIAQEFAQRKTRGLITYILLSAKAFFNYRALSYKIVLANRTINEQAFTLSIANGAQYGNNAYIAPKAKMDDGKLNLVIVKPFSLFSGLSLLFKLFNKKIDSASAVHTEEIKTCMIKRKYASWVHLDGEPFEMGEELNVMVHQAALKVIVS